MLHLVLVEHRHAHVLVATRAQLFLQLYAVFHVPFYVETLLLFFQLSQTFDTRRIIIISTLYSVHTALFIPQPHLRDTKINEQVCACVIIELD